LDELDENQESEGIPESPGIKASSSDIRDSMLVDNHQPIPFSFPFNGSDIPQEILRKSATSSTLISEHMHGPE
jgi:hypothetical protein